MLRLSAAHLHEQRRSNPEKKLVWVDIGGGTGWNVEGSSFFLPPFSPSYLLRHLRLHCALLESVTDLLCSRSAEMDKYFPISQFDAVYVLDLCGPLLDVSKQRFAARGWTNVHCLLQDATHFVLPTWTEDGVDVEGDGVDFLSMSYSLSCVSFPPCRWRD
jgi:betaine lipid synthase